MDIHNSSVNSNHEKNTLNDENKEMLLLDKNNDGNKDLPNTGTSLERTTDLYQTVRPLVEDEDTVLDGDDSTKDFDGNIDEDELLKDTDMDDHGKNGNNVEENELILNSEIENSVQCVFDTKQNISDATPSPLQRLEEACLENLSKRESSKFEDETETVHSISINPSEVEEKAEKIVRSNFKTIDVKNKAENLEPNTNISSLCANETVHVDFSSKKLSALEVETETVIRTDEDNSMKSNNDVIMNNSEDRLLNSPCPDNEEHSGINKNNEKDKEAVSSDEKEIDTSEENDQNTKFFHVDQDNTRPDDTFDSMDTTGEDPFAQTIDEAMEISENCEKDTELDKTQISHSDNEAMEVDESGSNSLNEVLAHTEHSTQSDGNATDRVEESSIDLKSGGISHSINSKSPHMEGITLTCNETFEDVENALSKSENSLMLNNSKDNNICIVPDKMTKQSQELDEGTVNTTVINMSKSRTGKTLNKSKNKSKKTSSEDSSDDSDFEVSGKINTRPKRTAAKKAESQIKVLSEVEREVEQEDVVSNDADSNDVEEIPDEVTDSEEIQPCFTCKKVGQCKVNVLTYGKNNYFCDENCFVTFRDGPGLKPGESTEIVPPSTVIKEIRSADIQPIERTEFIRKCSQCSLTVIDDDEKTLSWETMDFCSEECLGKYQQELGSHCANCKGNVQPASLGKYCVRFGYEVKQFCCSSCLEEFKKGLKVCSFCQKDISNGAEGFLAPVGDKGTFKDFCTQTCMEKYEQMSTNQPSPPQILPCDVCDNKKLVEVEVFFDNKVNKLCSDICFTAYKFANKLTVDRCDMCRKYFDKDANGEKFNIFYDGVPHNFCCKTCMNVYILAKRKIVPCNWCKVKKYNFDMIKRVQNTGQVLMMCSLNCLTLYQVSVNAVSSRRIKCDMCMSVAQAQYHLTMSDATIRNFCTYPCVMNFQQQYSKSPITLPGSDSLPVPTGAPKRVMPKNDSLGGPVPLISSVTSLANGQTATNSNATTLSTKVNSGKPILVTRMFEPPLNRNKNTQARPVMNTKSVSCRPHSSSVHVQTDEHNSGKPLVIPIPVPIYVPCPMAMYSLPFPVPVPFPLPVPVPMFLPTTRNSIKGIMKEIKRIQEKVPADPFEAELLMMAEMVAEDKKEVTTSSDSEHENEPASSDTRPNSDREGEFSPETIEASNTFGEDIMQMALKMATELDEPAVDLETQLTPATILNQTQSEANEDNSGETVNERRRGPGETRGRKRSLTRSPQKRNEGCDTKKRKSNHSTDSVSSNQLATTDDSKPDGNLKLKYTFGVNAWKSWVAQKNAEIEKLSNANKKIKPFKTDILQLTVDELNFSLCFFVKEVKKPNGTQYAPDTIYYLCLGIQLYLFENGRIENIFTDAYFETFTDSLDEIARKFTELFSDHHYIVTRVEEEHLWESKQLGAHSPHVLLSTLMFFNTKHFNLTTVEEHMLLSFSHIMKHWKKNPNQSITSGGGRAPGSRNVLLRFYPPQAVTDDPNSKKKKVYEQHENEENPLRCPVKLYEFYLSKCPESVRSRNDVFYLQPERSCVPDSPVWYSTMALSKEPLEKMLNRIKMVKEINIALLVP